MDAVVAGPPATEVCAHKFRFSRRGGSSVQAALPDDYGSLNLDEPFTCLCSSPHCRGLIRPDDPERHAVSWDLLVKGAFCEIGRVGQPL